MQVLDGCEETSDSPKDRYRMGEVIGEGGLGKVYRAEDTQLHRLVAIKRLHTEVKDSGEGSARILSEARNLAALQHPNIVTVYDVIANGGDVVVVMELLSGRTLQEMAESAPLGLDEFLDVMRQALEGLAAAHAQGMLHRDIKPSNLMLSQLPSGASQLKILDFGMAKIAPEPSSQTKDADGGLMGSIYMMSPEQLQGAQLDVRSDLYSLGCVAYFALTGHYPFGGKTVVEVITGHLQGRKIPLGDIRPDLPAPVCVWVERLMAVRPEDRPDSAAAAAAELNLALARKFVHVVQTLEEEAPAPAQGKVERWAGVPSRRRRIRWADLGVALFLVAICYLISIFLIGPKEAPPAAHLTVMDQEALLDQGGQTVVVEGVVKSVRPDSKGGFWRMNFAEAARGDLTLVFYSTENPAWFSRHLSEFVGRRVRVRGTVTEQKGAPEIFVESFSQIETL